MIELKHQLMTSLENKKAPPILIVDDNLSNLKILSQILKHSGWKVAIAKDGYTALKQVKHILPSVILLDVMMPGIDGFETCKRFKAIPAVKDIPIIFMTALNETEYKLMGFSLGAVDYITKPFESEEVLARVESHYKLHALTLKLEELVASRTNKLQASLQELKKAQLQLIQQEKMATLGNSIAGVAHEINNPLNFVSGNLSAVEDYLKDLLEVLSIYREKVDSPELEKKIEEYDLDFLVEDFPKAIESMRVGIKRIQDIDTSLRVFSRTDTFAKVPFDLHEGLDGTLLILKYRLKANEDRPEIQVIKNYGNIPNVSCFAGQLNQVFMNLLANSIDALDEACQGLSYQEIEANPKQIEIKTEQQAEQVVVTISDNGLGMDSHTLDKMFDQGFTTKAVNKGSGLGMTISRQIVVENHGGELAVESEVDRGSKFSIHLPIS